MSEVILVEAQPWAPDGTPVSVRLAGGGSRGYTHRGYLDWVPGVASRPRFTAQIGFDVAQGGFTGGAIPTTGALGFLPSDPAVIAAIAQLVWTDAPIIVRVGDDDLADPLWTTLLVGTVAGMVVRGGQASFTIADLSRDLAKPLLTDRFAGTGGVEGIAEAKERIKRRSWGRCWNVEARILDKANNIYELGDPARPLLAIDAVKDKGRAADQVTVLGWQGSIAATFAALQAASVPAGGAVVAPSIACVKWWTQPVGPLTADLRGEIGLSYVEACAAIAARVIAARAPTMAVNGVAEAIAARPGACGLHVDQDSETAGQALDRLLLGASLLWIVEPTGAVRLAPIAFTGAVETLVAIEAEREAVYKPVTERLLGYQRNQRQHSDGELSAVFQASDGTYRDGTPIEDLKPAERGANVTQTNVAAAVAGQGALATRNFADWASQVQGAGKPQDGATVGAITGGNLISGYGRGVMTDDGIFTQIGTAAAIAGQGQLATQSAVTWGGQITGRPTPLVDGIVAGSYFDARYTQNPIDGYLLHQRWPAEFGANVTETRVASAIAGQGLLATRSYADWATQVVGTGKPEDRATNDRGDDTRNDDFSPAYYRANYLRRLRTEFKSLAVVGVGGGGSYGTFETYAQWSDASGGPVWQRVTDSAGRRFIRQSVSEAAWGAWQPEYSGNRRPGFGDGDLLETYGGAVATLGNFKTGLGTAAAISGQGSLATRNDVLYDSQISGLPVPIQPGNLRDGQRIAADQVQYWSGPAQVVVTVDSLRPQEAGANVTESRVASAVAGQSPWATYGGLAPGNVAGQVQGLDTAGNLSGLTRVIDRRLTLLVRADGTTVVTETLVVTAIGVAAAIAGQGAGATANNLAQLDPTAASQLAAVAGGGIQVAALYGTIRKVMAADATLNFDAAASIGAGGNSGTVRVVIQVSPAGAESWSDVAVGAEAFVSASEPAEVTVSGSFTNTSGVQQVLEIRAVDRRTPASAGGAVIASQSFLRG